MAAAIQADAGARTIRRTAWAVTGGLAASAWLALVVWDRSPWGRFLDHGTADEALAGAAALGIFVAAWVLMLAAMMLPTTAPLVALFARVVAERLDRRRLTATVLAGYTSVWVVAGLVAYAGDEVLHAADERWGVVGDRGRVLVAGALALAGAYQLTSLKQRCLTACRSPYGVLLSRWRGRAPLAEAYTIGVAHGRTCVGCCWALMVIMFAIGAGSLGWMLLLAAVMTVEKTAPRGALLTRPLGALLLATAGVLVVAHL
jgi:predicted metal-binding membrane protein